MLRGYRLFVLALGLILIGAGEPPKADKQPKQQQSESDLTKAVESVGSAIINLKETTEDNPPCNSGEDNRNSDLCAQWKAADSARDASQYAFWTMLLGIIGTVLLVLTFWETRKTSRAQLRAYVEVKLQGLRLNGKTGEAEVEIKVCNQGQTPAFNSIWAGNVVISTLAKIERDLAVTPRERPPERDIKGSRANPATVNGGQESDGSLFNHKPFTTEELQAAISGEKSLFVFGFVWYVDAFGVKRETIFCFQSGKLPPPRTKSGPFKIDERWSTTPFFNEST